MAQSLGELLHERFNACRIEQELPYAEITRKLPTVRWLSAMSSNAQAAQRLRRVRNLTFKSPSPDHKPKNGGLIQTHIDRMIPRSELIWSRKSLKNAELHDRSVTLFFNADYFFIAGGYETHLLEKSLDSVFRVIRGKFSDIMNLLDVDLDSEMGRQTVASGGVVHANRDPRVHLDSWQKLAVYLDNRPRARCMHILTTLVQNTKYAEKKESEWKSTPNRLTLTNYDRDAVYIADGRVYMKVVRQSMPLLPSTFTVIPLEKGDQSNFFEHKRRLVTGDQVRQYFHANY